jgi:PDZ domain-containing secreted protein
MVSSVTNSGPSADILKPGDLIQAVDETITTSISDVQDAVAQHHVGDAVPLKVVRDGTVLRPTVTTRATAANPKEPILGIGLTTVKKHLEATFAKLGVENRTSAAALALERLATGT